MRVADTSTLRSRLVKGAIILAIFALIVFVPRPLVAFPLPEADPYVKWSIRALVEVAGTIAAVAILFRSDLFGALREIRLTASFLKALGFGFLVTFPMVLAFGLTSDVAANADLRRIFFSSAVASFTEEVLFRGFAFWMLYRFAGWNFWLAALVPALVFGYGHLYQSPDFLEATAIFAITAVGSVWFSWLLLRWDNLWVPIVVHGLMNLWWEIFAVDQTGLGGGLANVSRLAVIALSVVVTIYRPGPENEATSEPD
ncbi:MAG TPA: CPBP family intramembrane glutamic endopeptidase [Aridibacter sp.]|nr:CPBP family intramembrane glutamic endopeptidase [Aridibacter sp.]